MYGLSVRDLTVPGFPGSVVQMHRSLCLTSRGLMAQSSSVLLDGFCTPTLVNTRQYERRMDLRVRCSAETPWSLMGRVVREDRMSWNETIQSGVILAAAVKESDMIETDFYEELQVLPPWEYISVWQVFTSQHVQDWTVPGPPRRAECMSLHVCLHCRFKMAILCMSRCSQKLQSRLRCMW
jgi:hypothetical protein